MRLTSLAWLTAASLLSVAACTDDAAPSVPGREPPSCAMTFTGYRIASIELPTDGTSARQLGLDLDGRDADGIDNQLGMANGSIAYLIPSWNAQGAFNGHLASGKVVWLLKVGTCADDDEVRVSLATGGDRDGDGTLEILEEGVPAVGHGGAITAARGIARVPVGALFDGDGLSGNGGWQDGPALAVALAPSGGDLVGTIGFGIDTTTDDVMDPLARFFTHRLAAGTSEFARQIDTNHDGTVDLAEARASLSSFLTADLDVMARCAEGSCYEPDQRDNTRDLASLGFRVQAVPVALE